MPSWAPPQQPERPSPSDCPARPTPRPPARHGSIDDVKHVVILMQENRSFDHYFGTLQRGARLRRPAGAGPAERRLGLPPARQRPRRGLPAAVPHRHHQYNAQDFGGLDHDWDTGHSGRQRRRHGQVGRRQGRATPWGTSPAQDIPFQYALADAFTICDGYHCSMNGPTDPNRLYLWSGTAGPGRDGTTGPVDRQHAGDREPGGRLDDLRRAAAERRRQLARLPQPRRLGRPQRRLRRQRAVVLQAVPRASRRTTRGTSTR